MMTVWKYPLGADLNRIKMPAGATLLHVDNKPCLWALVDPDAQRVTRHVCLTGTGVPIARAGAHVGSLLMRDGDFVFHFHVFDLGESDA